VTFQGSQTPAIQPTLELLTLFLSADAVSATLCVKIEAHRQTVACLGTLVVSEPLTSLHLKEEKLIYYFSCMKLHGLQSGAVHQKHVIDYKAPEFLWIFHE
jgi:hypothetical protein